MKDDGGRVVGLKACHIMQLEAVEIDLQGESLVMISGKNDAGKTTALDIFAMTVGGAKLCPKEPISKGETEGFSRVEMEGYTATRTFRLKNNGELVSELILIGKDGGEIKSAQTMLDRILGPLAIDPLEFTVDMLKNPKKARDTLLNLLGVELDLDGLARARLNLYDQRTRVNRDIKNKKGELAGMPQPNPSLLVEEILLADITKEYQVAQQTKKDNDQIRYNLERANTGLKNLNGEIDETQTEIAEAEKKLKELREYYNDLHDSLKSNVIRKEDLQLQIDALVDPDFDAIGIKIAEAEETNREIRAAYALKGNRLVLESVIGSLGDDSDGLSHGIMELDAQKDEALQSAEFPVHGLTVDETGIRFNDLPLTQASQSERIKIGLAILKKKYPKASLIRIYDGSALDSANRMIIKEFARENGLKVLMEVVDETGSVGIVIKDGVVAKVN